MIAAEHTVLILLAAGRSSRFGADDKLAAELSGQLVGYHVVSALQPIPFRARLAVGSGGSLDFARRGYTEIRNARPELGMSESVRLGVSRARDLGAAAVLVVLADMPRVTAAHVRRLFDAAGGPESVVASSDGAKPCPPVLFGAARFDVLLTLTGDQGARDLIKAGRHVVTDPAELVDIDTPGDLRRLRELVSAPEPLLS